MRLDKISPHDRGEDVFRVVIETSRGSRNKYSYDPEIGAMVLKKVLPEGHVFPFDFGFIPRTEGDDGDPIDVLVMMDEPTFAGCVVECRIVGVLEAKQEGNGRMIRNDRFIAVAETSLTYRRIRKLHDIEHDVLSQIQDFFVTYNREAGKKFEPLGFRGSSTARRVIKRQKVKGD